MTHFPNDDHLPSSPVPDGLECSLCGKEIVSYPLCFVWGIGNIDFDCYKLILEKQKLEIDLKNVEERISLKKKRRTYVL